MEKQYKKSENWHGEGEDENELPPLVFKDGKLYSKSSDLFESSENGEREDLEKKNKEKERQNIKKYVVPNRKNKKNTNKW
jgi:hypothetical protein